MSGSAVSSALFVGLLVAVSCVSTATGTAFTDLLPEQSRPVLTNLVGQEFTDIADAAQTFTADFYLTLFFQQPGFELILAPSTVYKRTPINAAEYPTLETLEVEMKTGVDVSSQYSPKYALHSTLPQGIDYGIVPRNVSWPWIEIDMRYRGTFRSQFDLKSFPFDTQILVIAIEFTRHTTETYYFHPRLNPNVVGVNVVPPTGFLMETSRTGAADVYYPNFNETYSRFQASVEVKRESAAVYGVRIISTLLITTVMTFFLYVFPIEETTRHGNAATFFLAAVAYMFVVMQDLPKIPYTTRLDNFIVISLLNNLTCYSWFSLSYWIKEDKIGYHVSKEGKEWFEKREPLSCIFFVLWYGVWSGVTLNVDLAYGWVWFAYGILTVLQVAVSLIYSFRNRAAPGETEEADEETNAHCAKCCPHSQKTSPELPEDASSPAFDSVTAGEEPSEPTCTAENP